MNLLYGGGEVVVGAAILVAWWLTVLFIGRRNVGKPMGTWGFALWPSLFLVWFIAGCVMILNGVGMI